MIHQSALAFTGENLVTWPHTDARGLGNTIQLHAWKEIWWPPGQSVIQRQTQPISNTQPELPIGCPLLRHTLSRGQEGLGKLSGCTAYLDRWGEQETKGFFPLMWWTRMLLNVSKRNEEEYLPPQMPEAPSCPAPAIAASLVKFVLVKHRTEEMWLVLQSDGPDFKP